MENNLDDQNAYERRDTLIFSADGLPISTTDEKWVSITQNLVKDKLRLELPVNTFLATVAFSQHLLSERLTSLGIMGVPRVPPLNPS